MTINDYLDMEALDNILEQWAAATHMIAVVLDDEGNFLSNKLGFSRNNVEAFIVIKCSSLCVTYT